MNWILYVVAAAAGSVNSMQAGANSQLRKSLDQPIFATMAVYLTGLMGISMIAAIAAASKFHWAGLHWDKVQVAPWWAWTGGLLSIGSTMAAVMLAQRMGSVAFTAVTLTFSLICSVLLDQFGWMGFQVHHANPLRLTGCALLVAGLLLVTRF